jgi:hypothetical protein
MKRFLAVPALFLAASAMAECPASLPDSRPAIPDGEQASRVEMYRAQGAVNAYVDRIESFLDCRVGLHPLQQSRGIYLAEAAADAYNTEQAKFRARERMLADN